MAGVDIAEERISIGQFAALTWLSAKALRIYHEQGILVPASVDPATGYRSYAADQIVVAERISLLRRAGIPLADIATFLQRPSVDRVESWIADLDAEVAERRQLLDHVAHLTRAAIDGDLPAPDDRPITQEPDMTDETSPALLRAMPMLASIDIDATLRFYADRLGFTTIASYPDHGVTDRDGIQIHLWLTDDAEIPKQTSCRVDVRGIDALHDEMAASGVVHPNGPLRDQPWGLREFSILDGDGNLITFAERAAT
jgi:DNA-binding transcriptional MerR regulator/catechol 2,3-dioxygenase-like lactoylglutathione lyase family enzyme